MNQIALFVYLRPFDFFNILSMSCCRDDFALAGNPTPFKNVPASAFLSHTVRFRTLANYEENNFAYVFALSWE